MNTSHIFKSKISMIPDYQQQQSGQKNLDLSFNSILHPLHVQSTHTNMFANSPFQRSFASVVSCKPPILHRQKDSEVMKSNTTNTNNDGILNNFLKKIVISKRTMLPPKMPSYLEPPHVQKEFEDFKTLPSYLQNQRTASKLNSHSMQAPKNKHAKQRHSIEHDIRVDCDIFNIKKVNNNNTTPTIKNIPTNAMRSATENLPRNNYNNTDNSNNPPFEIYSLEEFPAIPSTVTSHDRSSNQLVVEPSTSSTQHKMEESDDSDYVKYQDDIAKVTPTFIPRRYNLCEKVTNMVKNSPKKFLNIPMMSPRRSCLKPSQRRRTVSECSDDFIVFDRSCCDENAMNDDIESESEIECEDSDVSDEEDDGVIQDDAESDEEDIEIDDECDGHNEKSSEEVNSRFESHQPDSGMEEKKVHFSLVPKVHVMIAWNFAYRQARKGDMWRQSAVDRERFAKRISECENLIKPILDRTHRNRIFTDRFQ